MVKKILLIMGIILMFLSCISTKNDYDMVRFKANRFSIKPNEDRQIYQKIDTSSVYLLYEINGERFVIDSRLNKVDLNSIKNGIKFYNDGKVGYFKNIIINNKESLNPQKAQMGFFNYKDGIIALEFINYHIQSGYFLSKSKVSINNDTLILKSEKTPQSIGGEEKYLKYSLPKDFLIYKPDW